MALSRLAWLALCCVITGQTVRAEDRVEFNRDVRPILADHCFACHGPDQAKRKAKLRLDTAEGAAKVIVAGDTARSELVRRITSADSKEHMPPPASRQPTPQQIDVLRRWIVQGAQWQKHWAFLPPRRPALPLVRQRDWPRNALDYFVLHRLEREGLHASPQAEPAALLRRVTFDLTGLPPTPHEVDAFLADRSPDAYERVVDRLLASPRYGERLAQVWLEAARYADTNGYQTDGERFMWRWRDWVIDAFNHNKPFDRFTVEQLAGDLLPNATLDQIIATGFNRNHRGNGEGGIIPEEYAVEYVVDRLETTATVWLGLTLGCARCHDHKFDPFTQQEFYRLFAYFNNVPEHGKAIKLGNSPPVVKAPTAWEQEQLDALDRKLVLAEKAVGRLEPELQAARAAWERMYQAPAGEDWAPGRGLVGHFPLEGTSKESQLANLKFVPGRVGHAGHFDGARQLVAGDVGNFGFQDKFSLACWIYPHEPQGGIIVSRMAEEVEAEGYRLHLVDGKLQFNLVKRWLDDALRVETETSLAPEQWHHLVATYDGSRVAAGLRLYLDGRPAKLHVLLDDLNQSFKTKQPFRIGGGGTPAEWFHGDIDEVRIYDRVLDAVEASALATPEPTAELLSVPADKRTSGQAQKVRAYFLEKHAPAAIQAAHRELVRVREERQRFHEKIATVMVMQESPTPRDTFVLMRGAYDKPGPKVLGGVPAALPPLPKGIPNSRLGLARWLIDPGHPLTARVAVNRYWQMLFGTGLVKTAEDFGVQGESPSHPELLDWLAVEFRESGWDVKAILRLMVLSATYRQSSASAELGAPSSTDPENRLLARGPRGRLPAEMIRDQALAVSGLLVERIGGPSAKPYQPAELWKELANADYRQDHGPNLYRRSLYTFWKRTLSPPDLALFDAAGRETCVVRRSTTNTPLQALTLMNGVAYLEAARVLAQRLLAEPGRSPDERLTLAFRLATSRLPRPDELQILRQGLRTHLARYRADPEAARRLAAAGEFPRDDRLDVAELAAYTMVASLVLNLDEAITKQ